MIIGLKKTYDKVNWSFGFPQSFIHLMVRCVTITKFSVKVNKEGYGYFEGGRELRQGDPLSPLLFVLVMEYHSRTLNTTSGLPEFKFRPMCKALKLTHLIFIDDLMIFCKGEINSIKRVVEALNHFSNVMGLQENVEKTSIILTGMDDVKNAEIVTYIGFSIGSLPIRYLGLPLYFKKWSKNGLAPTSEKDHYKNHRCLF